MATIEFKASDGTVENTVSYTFREADAELYMEQMPRQSQEITGYFDMSWANTKGYVYDEYEVERSNGGAKWDAPTVYQDATPSSTVTTLKGSYSGGGFSSQIGQTARCLRITPIVQELYKKRIERTFSADAGKTFAEIKGWRYYRPVAKGKLGSVDGDVQLQNSQTMDDSGFCLLTDTVSYPALDGDTGEVPEIDPDGEKYALAPDVAVITLSVTGAVNIGSSNSNYRVKVGGKTNSGSLSHGTHNGIDSSLFASLQSMFSGAKLKRVSPYQIVATASGRIELLQQSNSCYQALGLVAGMVVEPVQDRTVDVTNSVPGCAPSMLFGATQTGEWVYNTYNDSFQSFTVDLLRAPLCKWQRDWRYEEGDDENPGDGIMTYEYDAPFSPNPFISNVEVKPNQSYPTSYRVYVKPDGYRGWRSVLNISYNDDTGKYEKIYGTATLDPQTGEALASLADGEVRARYVKVECDSEMQDFLHSYPVSASSSGSGYQVIAEGDFSGMGMLSLEGIQAVISNRYLTTFGELNEAMQVEGLVYEIVAAQVVGDDDSRLRISLNRLAYEDASALDGMYISFIAAKQVGGIAKFKVWGMHYKTESSGNADNDGSSGGMYLTMTGMEDEYSWGLGTQTTVYRLPEVPTQILEVSVGTAGSAGVTLTEVADVSALRWTTAQKSMKVVEVDDNGRAHTVTKQFRRITGGTYHYDVYKGTITIPRTDQSGVRWEKFEEALKGTSVLRSYMPDTLTIRYWSGNGRSITFKAKADGHGPSYMLEKNAIQEVVNASDLPDNGRSCKILDVNGVPKESGVPIPWICYNNRPSCLSIDTQSKSNSSQGVTSWSAGEFRLPSFTGKELGDSVDDDSVFVKLYGEHCENCFGQCETEVTLTGAPNRIISGHLQFRAAATTRRTIDVGGKKVVYEEPTGGLDNSIIVVSCAPSDAGNGRMTKCYSLPEIVIYAHERQLFKEADAGAKGG